MTAYTVVIEKAEHNFAAYVPDLPGCIATGKTREDAQRMIREAICFHLEGLIESGYPVPPPTSTAIVIEVPATTPPLPSR